MKKINDIEFDKIFQNMFLKEIKNISNPDELREKLENTIFVLEETKNEKNSTKESLFIPKERFLENIISCQENIDKNSFDNESGNQKISANFYKIKDVDNTIKEINKISDDDLEKLREVVINLGFKKNCIKNIELEDVERKNKLEESFKVLEQGIEYLKDEKNEVVRFDISKENGKEKGYFSVATPIYSNVLFEIETENIKEVFDKAFKYLSTEDFKFSEMNEKFTPYDNYRKFLDFSVVTNDERQEIIDLDNNILCDEVKDLKIGVTDDILKSNIDKVEINLSSYPQENYKKRFSISSNEEVIKMEFSKENVLTFGDVASILSDRDVGEQFFEKFSSETIENKKNVEYVLEEISKGLSEISKENNSFYNLEIKKENFSNINYKLSIKDDENKFVKEINNNNIKEFSKEVFDYLGSKGKEIDRNILENIKDTKQNIGFSVEMYNTENGNDLTKIKIPITNETVYILEDFTSKAYTYRDMKDIVKNLLTKNDYAEEEQKNKEHIYKRTDVLKEDFEKNKDKVIEKLNKTTYEEYRNNVIANGFENSFKIRNFNFSNENIKENIINRMIENFESNNIDEIMKLLENGAEKLGLTLNENNQIKEFLENKFESSENNIEDIYKENAINFYIQKSKETKEKILEELNDVFKNEEYKENSQVSKNFYKLKEEKEKISTGLLEEERNFIGAVFLLNIKEQDEYLSNYDKNSNYKESKKNFKENFNLDKFNKKLEEVGYHKISEDKAMKIINSISIEDYDVFLEKNKINILENSKEKNKIQEKEIKKEEKEF